LKNRKPTNTLSPISLFSKMFSITTLPNAAAGGAALPLPLTANQKRRATMAKNEQAWIDWAAMMWKKSPVSIASTAEHLSKAAAGDYGDGVKARIVARAELNHLIHALGVNGICLQTCQAARAAHIAMMEAAAKAPVFWNGHLLLMPDANGE